MINWKKKEYADLVEAFVSLRTTNDMQDFLRDLATESEITEFAKRFRAARMLADGTSYTIIEKETGLSSTTIASVSLWLNGKKGGYK